MASMPSWVLGVEATVADEVEDVVGVAPQLALQGAQRRLRQPHHLHPSPLGELAECCGDVAPFLFAIQLLRDPRDWR